MKTIIRFTISMGLLITFCLMAFAENRPLTVLLDVSPNPDHTPLIIAQQLGYFKKQGIRVKLLTPNQPHVASRWITKGKADIAILNEPEFMQQINAGKPLVRIGTLIDYPLNCLVALKTSGIRNIQDLKGKRIGSLNANHPDSILHTILSKGGLRDEDVTIVNYHNNLTDALLSHEVDAVFGIKRNIQTAELNAKKQEFVIFLPENYGVPPYDELIFMTHENKIKDNRIPKFMEAIREAIHYIDLHPREAWSHFISIYPNSNHPVPRQAFFDTLPYFAEEPGEYNSGKIKNLAEFIQKNEKNELIKT